MEYHKLTWTRTAPTRPGYWWWRKANWSTPKLLQVYSDSDLTQWLMARGIFWDRSVMFMGGEWSDRVVIEEPREK